MLTKDQIERYYKTQSGSSTPLSPIEFAKQDTSGVNTNEITTIGSTDPVISSKDLQPKYSEGSDRIDTEENLQKEASKIVAPPTVDTTGKKPTEPREEVEATGDSATDSYNKYISTKQVEADQASLDAETKREQRDQLFKTSLANIDATTQATLNNIGLTYDKRLTEQKRINQLNIDRVKAYGLGGGGIYTPNMFSDAITNREEEADAKITSLENDRNNLISQAKSARDAGEAGLMGEKLDKIDEINETLNNTLNEIDKEISAQYKIFKDYNKELEAEHLQKIEESRRILSATAQNKIDEYEENPEAFIQDKLNDPNYTLSYADIVEIMNNAIYSRQKATEDAEISKLDIEDKKAGIEATKALTKSRKASAFKSYADAGVKNQERQDEIKAEKEMKDKVPDIFADETTYFAERSKFVKEFGVDGGKYWDSVYPKDADGDPIFPKEAKKGNLKSGSSGTTSSGIKYTIE